MLKNCPFCGSVPVLVENCMDAPAYASAYVKCRKCGANSNHRHRTVQEALTWWNNRKEENV